MIGTNEKSDDCKISPLPFNVTIGDEPVAKINVGDTYTSLGVMG
jgi:hypothetical protein